MTALGGSSTLPENGRRTQFPCKFSQFPTAPVTDIELVAGVGDDDDDDDDENGPKDAGVAGTDVVVEVTLGTRGFVLGF
jgi:hypothetical protein